MTRSRALALTALLAGALVTGCATYSGAARAIEPERVTAAAGWVVVPEVTTVRQHGLEDCGPAALAIVAQHWNVRVDGSSISITDGGARLDALRDAARRAGLEAFAITADRDVLSH